MGRRTSVTEDDRGRLAILGVPVDRVTMWQAVERLNGMLENPGLSVIVTPNSEIVVRAEKDPELLEMIRSADMVIPDGIGLVYASRIFGEPLRERVTGIDFLNLALAVLEKSGQSVYLLGSRPGKEGQPAVAEKAAERIRQTFPGLTIAGVRHGYFDEGEESAIVEEINRSGADFLCVALGSPKQEKFIQRHREKLNPRVAIGVGGSLDVYAGAVRRAPAFFRNHGLEWLYRLIQEPTRYKRMAALPTFMLKVAAGRIGLTGSRGKAETGEGKRREAERREQNTGSSGVNQKARNEKCKGGTGASRVPVKWESNGENAREE